MKQTFAYFVYNLQPKPHLLSTVSAIATQMNAKFFCRSSLHDHFPFSPRADRIEPITLRSQSCEYNCRFS